MERTAVVVFYVQWCMFFGISCGEISVHVNALTFLCVSIIAIWASIACLVSSTLK